MEGISCNHRPFDQQQALQKPIFGTPGHLPQVKHQCVVWLLLWESPAEWAIN